MQYGDNMLDKLQVFYKSRKWENFVALLRSQRATADGTLYCEHCGKPIVKSYDCVGHHIEELTLDNVDDVNVSLNPSNVILVHFDCHNAIHHRFGYALHVVKQVFIVYGAPCSGKTTFVSSVAHNDDLILDIDRLYSAIRADCCGEYDKPNAIKSNVFGLRDCLLDMIKVRRGRWNTAYIIGGYPLQSERERLADSVGANKLIFIDTPKEVCLERAKLKTDDWSKYVDDWFDKYIPPVD